MSTITQAGAQAILAPTAAGAGVNSLMGDTQDRFLTLLVTQLQNQDPLNPMDNAQVTSQIAQLSTVNGINQLNNTLLALSGQMDMSQSMQAAGLIGKGVLVPGARVALGGPEGAKAATPFGVDMISGADKVVATIMNASGAAVRQMDLGPRPAGVATLSWDGRDDGGAQAPDGAYTIQVHASNADGQAVSAQALTYGQVGSVAQSSGGPQLDLGLTGTRPLSDIRKIM